MKEVEIIMGMPVMVEVTEGEGQGPSPSIAIAKVFDYFRSVDEQFSTYKPMSEISRINRGEIVPPYSKEMTEVLSLAEKTRIETGGFFNIKKPSCEINPSGIVKGWAIQNASLMLDGLGVKNFSIDAGGDIQSRGSHHGDPWSVGIRNPFDSSKIVKIIYPLGMGVATSGSYERGSHIYNPLNQNDTLSDIVSITVIGPNVLEADRFATAGFAMGKSGIHFIESLPHLEAYAIDKNGIATMTSNLLQFCE